MSNFKFIIQWPEILTSAQSAESVMRSDPRTSCFHGRRTLELAVKWMYLYDKELKEPYDNKLSSLIHDPIFKNSLPPGLIYKLIVIQKTGNLAVHSDAKISDRDSLQVLKELHHFLYWFYRTYSKPSAQKLENQIFSIEKIPNHISIDASTAAQSVKKLRELSAQLEEQDRKATEKLAEKEHQNQKLQKQIEELKSQISLAKLANQQRDQEHPDKHNYNEAETRQYLVDQYLKEAGWDISKTESVSDVSTVVKKISVTFEEEIDGMPNNKNLGYVDYVLWGHDGLPLAVVEAKRAMYSAKKGKQQALLYTNCLEEKYHQRPLIFYTNGYEIYFWDDSVSMAFG